MKVTHLLYTSIFATTTWAHSQRPSGFFAKVDDQYVPLSSTLSGDRYGNANVLAYGDGLSDPTKFTLQGKHAFTLHGDTKRILGDSEGSLVHYDQSLSNVSKYIPVEVELDRERRLSNVSFYSCARSNENLHVIRTQKDLKRDESCFKVDIYLLPYGKNLDSEAKHDQLSKRTENDPKLMDLSEKPGKSSGSSYQDLCMLDISANDDDAAAEKLSYEGKHPSSRKINETECETAECVRAKNSFKINEDVEPNVTAWKTYTDYTTYLTEETNVTVTVCEKVCNKTTLSVASATTLTVKGVVIVPETATVKALGSKSTARASNLKQSHGYAPNPTKSYQPKASKDAALKVSKEAAPKFSKVLAPEPSVSYFNAASRNAIGAFFFGFAALLL